MIYRGTSVSLWLVEGVVAIFAAAFLVWLALKVLLFVPLLALVAVVAFLLWWASLEVRDRLDRRRPSTTGMWGGRLAALPIVRCRPRLP